MGEARATNFSELARLDPGNRYNVFDATSFDDDDSSSSEDESSIPWYRRRITCLIFVGLLVVATALIAHSAATSKSPTTTTPRPLPLEDLPPIPAFTAPTTTTRNPLLPIENLHDNNVCDDSEELYGGLCYKKCSLLTQGSHPIRTSSWTCCQQHPCTLNQVGKIGTTIACDGYDVGSSTRCPHAPGTCLTDEEFFLGQCYEKCSLLTQGEFPTRVGPASCCKTSGMGCLDPRKDQTNADFNRGGGQGDNDPSTPRQSHGPLINLTEASGSAMPSAPPTLAPGTGGRVGQENRCGSDEELYAGLCYKRCSLLTMSRYPIRTSSWTCCESHPCAITNQKGSIGHTVACDGFDTGGEGHNCPHKPFACRDGEDEILGVCYTSCAVLTAGKFPHRLTGLTCCKEASLMACLNIGKDATSIAYDVASQ
eukprot:TRINITY_DN23997_c0_g1_i1.p1 TRINITY_DN23997_c0_g1~~TRINITY_DN23997_c0_g1_i1.p1  ORF type:complete len:437 (-),score=39.31 TRINITY_DN23997_c0_g1_i1:46-1317(-)